MRYALILETTGLIDNVIEVDDTFSAPAGYELIQTDTANIGDTFSDGVFSGPTFIAPAAPTVAQLAASTAASAISAGLAITSASTPSTNGTYPVDAATQTKIASIELFIVKNGAFPGTSGASLAWYDTAGTVHIFPSVAIFSEFSTAIANYVADLDLYGAGAPGATLPATSVTIA